MCSIQIAKFNYFELLPYTFLLVRIIQEELHRTSRKQVCYHKKLWPNQNSKQQLLKSWIKLKFYNQLTSTVMYSLFPYISSTI